MYCAQKDNLTVIRHCQGLLLQQRSNDITATSVLELAVEIIKFMNPAKLALPPKKPGPSPSIPPQDWYFKEFYRASESIMEGGILLVSRIWSRRGHKGRRQGLPSVSRSSQDPDFDYF
jgi:hypothetical protein